MGTSSITLFLGYLVSTYNLSLKQRTSESESIILKRVFKIILIVQIMVHFSPLIIQIMYTNFS